MVILVKNKYIEMTPEEIAAIQAQVAEQMVEEAKRPLTMEEVVRLTIAKTINSITIEDDIALRMVEFYPEWAEGQAFAAGYKAQRSGKLWRCLQAHTAQNGWEPENAASLQNGKYYTQGGVLYKCTRDTGNPVYHALSALVGIYVEVVENGS